MRIDDVRQIGFSLSPSAQTCRVRTQPADEVRISSSNSQKMEKLAAAVDAGTYRVPAWQIAGSIMEQMLASS